MDFSAAFHDPELCSGLLRRLRTDLEAYGRPVRFMEVCGTHTVAIWQSGLRSLLPEGIIHLSGPGCPVCVTHDSEVAAFLDLAGDINGVLSTSEVDFVPAVSLTGNLQHFDIAFDGHIAFA